LNVAAQRERETTLAPEDRVWLEEYSEVLEYLPDHRDGRRSTLPSS
jgi:hypothetical protein